jgi:hypothetical protein
LKGGDAQPFKGLAFGSPFLLPTLPNASILQDLAINNDDGMVCFRQGFGGRPAFAKASAGGVGLATLILERGRCSTFAKVSPSARLFLFLSYPNASILPDLVRNNVDGMV